MFEKPEPPLDVSDSADGRTPGPAMCARSGGGQRWSPRQRNGLECLPKNDRDSAKETDVTESEGPGGSTDSRRAASASQAPSSARARSAAARGQAGRREPEREPRVAIGGRPRTKYRRGSDAGERKRETDRRKHRTWRTGSATPGTRKLDDGAQERRNRGTRRRRIRSASPRPEASLDAKPGDNASRPGASRRSRCSARCVLR